MAATQGEQTYDQYNNNIYKGHFYKGNRFENDGVEFFMWISFGTDEEICMYQYDEHAHNAIDIVKSTWAYGQWTNQIFGKGWEERIDLKDELKEVERNVSAVRSLALYWKYIWDSIL